MTIRALEHYLTESKQMVDLFKKSKTGTLQEQQLNSEINMEVYLIRNELFMMQHMIETFIKDNFKDY